MITVTLMNPEVVANLYRNHGQFACVCYNTPEKHAERVGSNCQASGHMSGSRCEYIKFRISGVDRGTAEHAMRHELGTAVPVEMQDNYSFHDYMDMVTTVAPDQIVKNCASFRYIDKTGFDWETPSTIRSCPRAKAEYDALMEHINEKRIVIKKALEDAGIDPKLATQDANFVLPRATTTDLVIGFTPEALIHFCHKRMCSRAQEFVREIAFKMRDVVSEHCPRFAQEMVPQCHHLLWCPENHNCCGQFPTREELFILIRDGQLN